MTKAILSSSLVVLRILVRNHPGVLSNVSGMFSRRAFNVEAIVSTPVDDPKTSCIWILIPEDNRIEQVVRQLYKLHDILEVTCFPMTQETMIRFTDCMHALAQEESRTPLMSFSKLTKNDEGSTENEEEMTK